VGVLHYGARVSLFPAAQLNSTPFLPSSFQIVRAARQVWPTRASTCRVFHPAIMAGLLELLLPAKLDYFPEEQKGPITLAEFFASSQKLAADKARELGWIV
jgi:hypothetical protein